MVVREMHRNPFKLTTIIVRHQWQAPRVFQTRIASIATISGNKEEAERKRVNENKKSERLENIYICVYKDIISSVVKFI